MAYPPTTNPEFLKTLSDRLRKESELLVLNRFRAGAGSKEFRLFNSFSELSDALRSLPAGTCFSCFSGRHLPFRGTVDDRFIQTCIGSISDGSEYLVTETVRTAAGKASWFHFSTGVSHAELREDLEAMRGKPVAAGLYPPWLDGPPSVLHAVVPDTDGTVRVGPC